MSLIVRRHGHERGRPNGEEGQTLVEFALILPILLIVVLGIVDLGKAFGYKNDLTNLANQAARLASVNQCPGGCTSIEAWTRNQAPNELRLGTGSIQPTGLQATSAITFTFTDPGPLNHCVGDSLRATVKVHYNWLNFLRVRAAFPSLGTDITATATMRLEKSYDRSNPAADKYAPLNPTPDDCPS
jgi:TadE-like protein